LVDEFSQRGWPRRLGWSALAFQIGFDAFLDPPLGRLRIVDDGLLARDFSLQLVNVCLNARPSLRLGTRQFALGIRQSVFQSPQLPRR
jgi:hypothetical protein